MGEQRPTDHDRTDHCIDDTDQVGLLYVSDVQALRRAEAVSFHTGDTSTWIDASLTAADEGRIYTAKEQRLFPDAEGLGRRRRIEVAADTSWATTTSVASTNGTCPAHARSP